MTDRHKLNALDTLYKTDSRCRHPSPKLPTYANLLRTMLPGCPCGLLWPMRISLGV